MADDADKAPEAAVTTDGDSLRDADKANTPGSSSVPKGDKPPGTFGEKDYGTRKDGTPRAKPGRKAGKDYGPRTGAVGATPQSRTNAWLTKRLTAILVAPSFAFEAVGESWPATHVGNAGPNLAREIANHADRNPAFKMRLEAFLEGGETAGLIVAAAMYVAPLGMYFGVIPAPERVRTMLAIPERGGFDVPAPPPGFGPPTPADLQAEAEAKGYADVGEYMNDVQAAINGVRKDTPGNLGV